MDRISNVSQSADSTDRVTDDINDRTGNIRDKVNNEMMPKLQELQGIVGADFDDIYVKSKFHLLHLMHK